MSKIINKVMLSNSNGGLYHEVHFEDGSVWSCDLDGKKWEKISLSLKELQESFDKNSKK